MKKFQNIIMNEDHSGHIPEEDIKALFDELKLLADHMKETGMFTYGPGSEEDTIVMGDGE